MKGNLKENIDCRTVWNSKGTSHGTRTGIGFVPSHAIGTNAGDNLSLGKR